MTEFETYSMFNQAFESSELLIERFLTLLFGFLIASYLVSAKLDRLMAAIVLSLYSVMALRYALVFLNASDDVIALAAELRTLAANPGSSISYLEIGPLHIFLPVVFAVMIASYFASIVFFFRAQSSAGAGRKTTDSLGAQR